MFMLMDFTELASSVGQALIKKSWRIVTAESCTGGWVAQVLTSVAGASACFERGFITYSNESKIELLGVAAETITKFGAVSEQTVNEMAQGALKHSNAQVSLAITGVAGPTGGSQKKPVGTIWFSLAGKNLELQTQSKHFSGNREEIRKQAVRFILQWLLEVLT
jgi:nicotinamide-nucleotide amidase